MAPAASQLDSRRAKEAAGSQSPIRVPCVQRQKMVSERPGLLLVPHTSSISSLVSSDMMGYRRAGLRFQDSRPGTWGRGAFRDRSCGTAAAKELGGWTGGGRKARGERATSRDRACQASRSGSKEFPVPEVPGHFRLPFRYRPRPRPVDPGVASPEAEVGGVRKSLGTLRWSPVFLSFAPGSRWGGNFCTGGDAAFPGRWPVFTIQEPLLPRRTAGPAAHALGPGA